MVEWDQKGVVGRGEGQPTQLNPRPAGPLDFPPPAGGGGGGAFERPP